MKKLLFILLLVIMWVLQGCDSSVTIRKDQEVFRAYATNIKMIRLPTGIQDVVEFDWDGCTYLMSARYDASVPIHKANCKNPIHKPCQP